MTGRFGVRTALIAVATMALAATPAAASRDPLRARVVPGGASTPAVAAAQQVLLPGNAEAAAVRSDPRNWLVSARPGAGGAAIARRFGARAIGSHQVGAYLVTRANARALAGALRTRGLLVSASPNVLRHRFQAAPTPDPLTPQQWWRNLVVNPATPTPPVTPTSPLLGLVDSMPVMTHPEWTAGSNFTTIGALPPDTTFGHGTATASVAAAPVNGVGIIGIWPGMRALNAAFPSPEMISCADSVAQIGNLINAGAAVINMSYGAQAFCPAEFAQLEFAVAKGIIPVASAGNEAAQGNPIDFPGALPHVLTAGATTPQNTPASFSNFNPAVDLAAPGVDVLAAVPLNLDTDGTPDGYTPVSGTSFSSPIVAAAATWVRAARPDLTPDQVAQVIRLSATDVAPAGWDLNTGFGLLNIDKALVQQAPPADPREPNDDIPFIDGTIIKPRQTAIFGGRKTVRGVALLDAVEDPNDVYRIALPGHRKVIVSVKPAFGDTDVSVYKGGAKSVAQSSRIIGKSAHAGSKTDAVTIRNRSRRQSFAYVRVFIHPKATTLDAAYVITVKRR
jgi:subtilisin family serine protease